MYCPRCGSKNLIKHGWQWRLNSRRKKVQRYRCRDCGRFTVHPSPTPPAVEAAEIEAERGRDG